MVQRRLVINADDFGFTRDVNEGIVEAHRHGILTAATLQANGAAFDDAARLALENPTLDVGCHLTLVHGYSVLDPLRAMPAGVPQLAAMIVRRQIRIYDELAAQVRRIVAAGIEPTHLDTHKHTILLPPVRDAVARIAGEFGIPWVRLPFDPAGGSLAAVPLSRRILSRTLRLLLRGHLKRALEKMRCRTTDNFIGFQITGYLVVAELVRLIHDLPAGTTELMCHPGRCGGELAQAPTRLKETRERELVALMSIEARDAVRESGVELVNYREL
jgi:predicted glycoside hydrolase/deacetylase ChbG (UPF0249 family)